VLDEAPVAFICITADLTEAISAKTFFIGPSRIAPSVHIAAI